ncbi:MAG TPA: DEAD/DEAH box helicase [Longimicrobiales bacterium]
MNVVTPRAAALRMLAARASATDPLTTSYSLAQHQVEAVARARSIMQRRGGVLIADGVGLGKTYIAAALIEQELSAGNAVTLVIPAALRGGWRQALRPVTECCPAPLQWLTHGQLSRAVAAGQAQLVVVDEAHAFRNPRTQRYRNLWRLCRAGRVLLLTATPVNNSLWDLYFQLRLFAADNTFADLGIGSLRALLGAQEVDHAALQRLRDDIMIRRTRAQVRGVGGQVELPGGALHFPRVVNVQTVGYPPLIPLEDIRCLLRAVGFSAYQDQTSRVLIALSLLKRIESSPHAIRLSLDRLIDFHRHWLAAFDAGRLLTGRSRLPGTADEQLLFAELLLPEAPMTRDAHEKLKVLVDRDLQLLIGFRDRLGRRPDAKQSRLLELLTARPPPARTLVFTDSRDTAEALWHSLAHLQVGLITGSGAFLGVHPASRAEVIRRFAPVANASPPFKASESVFVLIATDVMSEGLNLQDADAVVSYDLPWNPVRLIQRAGRIDRLGSTHDQVYVYNFIPDHDLEELLGLIRRLRSKLHRLRSAVGQEAEVLEPGEPAMADNAMDALQVVAAASDMMVGDFSGAAPPGNMAVTSLSPKKVLVSLGRSGIVRELIVAGNSVFEDPAAAGDILASALSCDFTGDCALTAEAVGVARAYLAREAATAPPDAGTRQMRSAVTRAVQRQGLLAPAELLSLADKVVSQLPGYLGPTRRHLCELASAATIYELKTILRDILDNCSSAVEGADGAWQLIAAIASD